MRLISADSSSLIISLLATIRSHDRPTPQKLFMILFQSFGCCSGSTVIHSHESYDPPQRCCSGLPFVYLPSSCSGSLQDLDLFSNSITHCTLISGRSLELQPQVGEGGQATPSLRVPGSQKGPPFSEQPPRNCGHIQMVDTSSMQPRVLGTKRSALCSTVESLWPH